MKCPLIFIIRLVHQELVQRQVHRQLSPGIPTIKCVRHRISLQAARPFTVSAKVTQVIQGEIFETICCMPPTMSQMQCRRLSMNSLQVNILASSFDLGGGGGGGGGGGFRIIRLYLLCNQFHTVHYT